MTKTEYMNTINEKLTAAEDLCTDLRKLRSLKKLVTKLIQLAVQELPGLALVSSHAGHHVHITLCKLCHVILPCPRDLRGGR